MSSRSNVLKSARIAAAEISAEQGVPFDVHHRHPRSRKDCYDGYINEKENLELVETELHRAWHKIVGNRTAEEVASLLTDKFISRHYYLVAVPRHKASSKRRQRRYCVDCQCEVLKHIPTKEE